jgi:hypothetical protein
MTILTTSARNNRKSLGPLSKKFLNLGLFKEHTGFYRR